MRTAQEMDRHSTPTLTARYSHPRLIDMASAAEKLPRFLQSKPDSQADVLRATGTDGKHVAQHVGPTRILLHSDASARTPNDSDELTADCYKSLESASLSTPLHSDALDCARRDSNSHPFRDGILSPARLPVPPLALAELLFFKGHHDDGHVIPRATL